MKQLLVEKYRPKTINDYVFQREDVKRKVEKWISDGEIPNLLLSSSSPGTGKSSLARVLANEFEIQSSDYKYVNASIEGIGYVRDVLEQWMKKKSFSKFKIVELGEVDNISFAAQKALLGVTEDYSGTVRFIATANYPNKLIPAFISRFQHIELDEIEEEAIINRMVDIVETEGLTINDLEDLTSHIDAYKPDMRKIINSIDEHTDVEGVLHPLIGGAKGSPALDQWEAQWASGKISLDILLQLTEGIDNNNFEQYYQSVYMNSSVVGDKQGEMVVLCSQYLERAIKSANHRLHLDAFLYEFFGE